MLCAWNKETNLVEAEHSRSHSVDVGMCIFQLVFTSYLLLHGYAVSLNEIFDVWTLV